MNYDKFYLGELLSRWIWQINFYLIWRINRQNKNLNWLMLLQKNWCITARAPVCAQLQQEEWFIIMTINISQFHLLPCISCWTWMSVKKEKMHPLGLFSSSVCREHWVWLYKLQFLFFYEIHFFFISAAWSWTNYIFESTSKGGKKKEKKTNGTQVDHTSNSWISTGLCVVAAATSAPTDRPPQQWPSHRLGETISCWIFSLHVLET